MKLNVKNAVTWQALLSRVGRSPVSYVGVAERLHDDAMVSSAGLGDLRRLCNIYPDLVMICARIVVADLNARQGFLLAWQIWAS